MVYWLFAILDVDMASEMFIRNQDIKSNCEAKEHTLENNLNDSENLI